MLCVATCNLPFAAQGQYHDPQQYGVQQRPSEFPNAPPQRPSHRQPQHTRIQPSGQPHSSPVRHLPSQILPHLPRSLSQSSEQAHPSHAGSGISKMCCCLGSRSCLTHLTQTYVKPCYTGHVHKRMRYQPTQLICPTVLVLLCSYLKRVGMLRVHTHDAPHVLQAVLMCENSVKCYF